MSNTMKPLAARADVYLSIGGHWTLERGNTPTKNAYNIRQDLIDSGHKPEMIRIVAAGDSTASW